MADSAKNLLGKPETRRFLMDFVKRRVPDAQVDVVVQTVLMSALESAHTPSTETELRRWLTGVAKHKIADQHRRGGREQPAELPDLEAAPPPVEERNLAAWAEGRAKSSKDAVRTLSWMAREGEGEKLEQIAVEENVEPAAVRQRVSRMRRWMKEQWALELALVAALALVGVMVWQTLRTEPSRDEVPRAETPRDRARDLRREALRACDASAFEACLRQLDQARDLDPDGDSAPEVQGARKDAADAMNARPKGFDVAPPAPSASAPAPSVSASSAPAPSASAAVVPSARSTSSRATTLRASRASATTSGAAARASMSTSSPSVRHRSARTACASATSMITPPTAATAAGRAALTANAATASMAATRALRATAVRGTTGPDTAAAASTVTAVVPPASTGPGTAAVMVAARVVPATRAAAIAIRAEQSPSPCLQGEGCLLEPSRTGPDLPPEVSRGLLHLRSAAAITRPS
jgi:DNA-directed RNA polymerase specialized sigma24 family protein